MTLSMYAFRFLGLPTMIKKRVAHADDVLAHDNAVTPRINDHSNVGINVSPCYVIINLTRCDEAIVN